MFVPLDAEESHVCMVQDMMEVMTPLGTAYARARGATRTRTRTHTHTHRDTTLKCTWPPKNKRLAD